MGGRLKATTLRVVLRDLRSCTASQNLGHLDDLVRCMVVDLHIVVLPLINDLSRRLWAFVSNATAAFCKLQQPINGDKMMLILVAGRYLKCVDTRGDTILLGLEQRGKFSALAREDNISGVHTARNLLSKRLPLTVRLVHGTAPRGLKSPSHFVPELR